ncbi:MAG: hypothetical protein ACE5EE_06140 [Fidelibacterota bacterium]
MNKVPLICVLFLFALPSLLFSQGDPQKGDVKYTQWGILDGNAVRTLYANHAEVARWPDQPSGEWPKGTGHSYVDGVALVIAVSTLDTLGNRIHPMSTNYREFKDIDPVDKTAWGWGPLPGYSNPRQSSPARSDDPFTWPDAWADKPEWAGEWNGYFGRDMTNADVETYFVCDDSPDEEWFYASDTTTGAGVFYPDPDDTTRGGAGMEVRVRGFQWSHVLAQDVIFWHYEIINEGKTDYDSVYFSQYIDWGIGGTDDSGDDEGGYSTYLDIAFAWDFNGIGQPGQWAPTGVAAYAFLESPGNPFDDLDNDEDGIVDEERDNDPGSWLDVYPYGVDDVVKFEEFYSREPRPHWEGDEDQDWEGYSDENGNGIWDPDEPLNDDVGVDGLAPYHPSYPGRDTGEGDGIPTDGEPDYNQTDKDESDQLGLTGFSVFDVHDYELINDEENWHEIFTVLQRPEEVYLEGGRNLGMFFSSGPFPMPAGHTERFSMALIFADKDFPDAPSSDEIRNSSLARKKETVQQIYNADYRFAQPPLKPILTAIPGDGQVILYWDDRAEDSFDPFLGDYDFEGYKIYRSTEPFFNEIRTITNTYGEETFKKGIAQFDMANGISGLHPVDIDGLKYNLGNDTGLRHYYIDRNVINGQTYYYAVVSYDRGLIAIDSDGNFQLDQNGHVRGLSPSECSAIIQVDISQNVETDINTAVVTPRVKAAGYTEGSIDEQIFVEWDTLPGPATGYVDVFVVQSDSLKDGHEYQLVFSEESSHYDDSIPMVSLQDNTSQTTLFDSIEVKLYGQEMPITNGLGIVVYNDTTISIVDSASGWYGDHQSNYVVTVKELILGDNVWGDYGNRKLLYPADYMIIFENEVVDTSFQLGWPYGPVGRPGIPVPFRVWNATEQKYAKFGVVERLQGDSLSYDHEWQANEPIIILAGDSAGADPVYPNYWVSWVIRLFAPEEGVTPLPPGAGDLVRVTTTKPFRNSERYRFTVQGAEVDEKMGKDAMDEVFVVPNPYVATSIFEPSNLYKSGRGERRIYFMGLPEQCTITIYTKSGKLVDTIEHNGTGGSGQEAWDLVSKDGMNIAYGIYFYVIEAFGQEAVGKFAVIK